MLDRQSELDQFLVQNHHKMNLELKLEVESGFIVQFC